MPIPGQKRAPHADIRCRQWPIHGLVDREHPASRHLPAVWEFTDEWYDFRANPRGAVRMLARADESSYDGGGMGADHPLVWCREQGAGRVFYTALGHASEAYDDADFRAHLLGGINWAARLGQLSVV